MDGTLTILWVWSKRCVKFTASFVNLGFVIDYFHFNLKIQKLLRQQQKYSEKLSDEKRQIRENWGKIYAQAEQEEEYISNTLLKRIHQLKSEKEMLAQRYETEMITANNDLQKTINQLQSERDMLEGKLTKEHPSFVDGLLKRIRNMEKDIDGFRQNIDRLRAEKIDQENALEHEQELLFNTLGKQLDQINSEKKYNLISFELDTMDFQDYASQPRESLSFGLHRS